MNFKKRVNGSWTDTPNYIHNTFTDTITTLPADIYPTGTTATVGLKGQMEQNGTPTPTTPIQPQETGERTRNLFDNFDIVAQVPSISNGNLVNSALGGTTSFIKIDSDEIVLSYSINANIYLFLYDNDYQYIGYISKTNGEPIYSTSISGYSNAAYCRVRVDRLADFSNVNIMLNTGSTALPYEPYGYKIPISSANTTTNVYLGEVQTTRKIKKLVLTGEENWTYQDTYTRFMLYLQDAMFLGLRLTPIICTHYIVINDGRSIDNIPNNAAYIGGSAGFVQLFIKTDLYTTAADFKSYLAQQYAAGTPITVWYVLATPETAVVNEPLHKIGDYADEVSGITIPTIAGANTIDVDTTLKPSEVSVNYHGWHPVIDIHEAENGQWD